MKKCVQKNSQFLILKPITSQCQTQYVTVLQIQHWHRLLGYLPHSMCSSWQSVCITNECPECLGVRRQKCKFEPIGLDRCSVKNYGLVTCEIKFRNSSASLLKTDTVVSHIMTFFFIEWSCHGI